MFYHTVLYIDFQRTCTFTIFFLYETKEYVKEYLYMQVIRGGDGKAGFVVRNPDGVLVVPYQWLSNSDYQDVVKNAGYFSICIDNHFSKYSSKLVNLYITLIR